MFGIYSSNYLAGGLILEFVNREFALSIWNGEMLISFPIVAARSLLTTAPVGGADPKTVLFTAVFCGVGLGTRSF